MTDPRPTTNRGRRAGGRELRAWASADEFETVTRAAEAAGVTREQFIRDAALGVAKAVAAALEARAQRGREITAYREQRKAAERAHIERQEAIQAAERAVLRAARSGNDADLVDAAAALRRACA